MGTITLVTPAAEDGPGVGDELALGLAVGAFEGLAETLGLGVGLALEAEADANGARAIPTDTRATANDELSVRAIFTCPPSGNRPTWQHFASTKFCFFGFIFGAERVTLKGYLGERNVTLR